MTKDNIGSLVGDLVAMARAYEELPQVQEALAKAHEDVETYARSLASRESHIIDLKAQIEEKSATIRSLEVARDDAELRFLELDEAADKTLSSMADIMLIVNDARLVLIKATKAEPVVEALTVPLPEAVHSFELHGNAGNVDSVSSGQDSAAPSTAYAPDGAISPGEREVDPTVNTQNSSGNEWPTANSETASETVAASSGERASPPTSAPSAPTGTGTENEASDFSTRFVGKKYIDVKGYYTLAEWLAGGGTSESYNDIDF